MLTRIGSAIGRDEHVLISGLRKAGKTSLLNILRQHLVGYPVCLADLQRFDRHSEDWPPVLFAMMVEAVDLVGQDRAHGMAISPRLPGHRHAARPRA